MFASNERLDREQEEKAVEWFDKHKFHFCSDSTIEILDDLVFIPVFRGEVSSFIKKIYPAVGTMCNECGKMNFYSAIKMEVLKHEEKPPIDNVPAISEKIENKEIENKRKNGFIMKIKKLFSVS